MQIEIKRFFSNLKSNIIVLTNRDSGVFRTRMTFADARERLDERFLTLMKGVIVNMDFIKKIEGSLFYLKNGSSFPVKVKKEKELREIWFNYKIAKIRGGGM